MLTRHKQERWEAANVSFFSNCVNYYYCYYYYKSTDNSDASLKLQGHFTYQIFKNDGSSQKSVVRQLKQMGLCLLPKRQHRRGGPDLCWQTVPRPRRCHRKSSV